MANAVVFILTNNKNEVLLQLRDNHASKYPNHWSFFGGAIDSQESPEQAIKREAEEELCYHTKSPQLILTEHIENDGIKYFFTECFDDSQILSLKEGKDSQWFSVEKAYGLAMPPHHKAALKKFLQIKRTSS